MRTQLQAISLRIQTVRSNEQMMQSMKGATMLLGSMNRQMNLPALQRIAMEFERENEIMDERQEMMDDAIDEATGLEDEEESEDIVKEVLDEIGVDLSQEVRLYVLSPFISLGYPVKVTDANTHRNSWAKLQQGYKRRLSVKRESRKQLVAGKTRAMTIFKQGLTAFDDDSDLRSTTFFCLLLSLIIMNWVLGVS